MDNQKPQHHFSAILLFIAVIVALTLIILFGALNQSKAQQVDTVIHTSIYTSYFDTSYGEPLFVVYKLYKGGGDCSREQFHFKNDIKSLHTAKAKDYAGSGYDEGHMANAEDFAGNCKKEELTFRFYNCLPQLPALNRGIWKHYETEARKASQTDSLLIICGGYHYKLIGSLWVPQRCWKIVKSLSTGKILFCIIDANDETLRASEMPLTTLEKFVPYDLKPFGL